MRTKIVLSVAVLAGLLLPVASSQAWVRVGIGIGIPIGGYYPYYPYYPSRVYVAPAPQVIYVQQPAATIVAQPAQVVQPVYQNPPGTTYQSSPGTTVYQAPPPQAYQPQTQTPPTPIVVPAR